MALSERLLPATGPQRMLAAALFVNSFGGGIFVASSTLYFTRVVKFSASQVALGLSIGSMAGLLVGIVFGHIADRHGPRETQVGVMLFGAASMSCFLLVRSFVPFVLVSVCVGMTYAAGQASRAPLIRRFAGDDPTVYRAYIRSVINLALASGALTAGIGIQLDTPAAYRALIAARVAAFLGSALIQWRLPKLPPIPAPAQQGRWAAVRDRTYLTAAVLSSVMTLHMAVPTFLLPLWIVGHTDSPRWLVSGILVINTLLIVMFQVPVSRGVNDHRAAGMRMRWAGAALCTGLALMAAAGRPGEWAAVGLLIAGMVAYTFGELWQAAAEMEWSFGLAPAHAQGQYSGVFGLGTGVAEALGPLVLTICLHGGVWGWLLIGAGLFTVGVISLPLVTLAERTSGRASSLSTLPVGAKGP
ncbi:MFS transporter [Planosporangium sp. 12N6]|uniref:MFS transporter n=1 Tax=Planosporangium spinosum TaxID=3402278 RepID=UPI003CEF8D40